MPGSNRSVFRSTAALVVLLGLCSTVCSQSWGRGQDSDSLHQTLGSIGSFTLTDQNGEAFSSDQLRGKVWVAHFFYVACAKCNQTTPVITEVQKRIRGKPDLCIVSISLNDDKPEVLEQFSKDCQADPKQWLFLTGPKSEVKRLSEAGFHFGLQENPQAEPGAIIEHDLNLAVVDRQGVFQGFISRTEPSAVDKLLPRMRELAGARYQLSAFNAALNFLCTLLLVTGYVAIRWRYIALHKTCMLAALATSTIFLASYLYYHFVVLESESPRFPGSGVVRYVYMAILVSHIILAAVVAPLALMVSYQGLRNNLARHVQLARWTLPIWLYVSITGVVVYWMLYYLYPRY